MAHIRLAVTNAGDGPPVVFIHGFPFDHALWRHQMALPGWTSIAPDLRGAGRSPSDGEYSMQQYAEDLVGVLDQRQLERAVFCGLSMGGYVLFEILRRFPARVRAAVLANTKAVGDTPEGKRDRDALAALAEREGAAAIAERMITKVVGRTSQAERQDVVAEVRAMMLRQPVQGIVGALRAMRDRPDSTPLLSSIAVPTLLIAGDEDQVTPAAPMRDMARAIPGATITVIASAGHVTPLEQPRAFNAALGAFLAGL
ncbi:MAG TPA: alpha/beta fold hydrolase [Burkholderiales bacterium]|nr:alpha/beta fold hydrolase [Burkholderiales bacterium]